MDCLPNTLKRLFDCLFLLMFFTILGTMVFDGFLMGVAHTTFTKFGVFHALVKHAQNLWVLSAIPVSKDYTFTWVDKSVVQLSLFQRKNRWSMAWVHGPVGDSSQRIGSDF
jgi:hypothetical protein